MEALGRQERINWTASEAPGRQEKTISTAWEAPGRHQGGRKQPARHQGGRKGLKGLIRQPGKLREGSSIKRAGCRAPREIRA